VSLKSDESLKKFIADFVTRLVALQAEDVKLALKICGEFAATNAEGKPLAGDYLNAALAGKEFFQMPKPRWESLHPIMGLEELFWITMRSRNLRRGCWRRPRTCRAPGRNRWR
jgi:hypothetical protein